MSSRIESIDYEYLNVTIRGQDADVLANFSERRVTPILNKSNDYKLSIVRFSIDMTLVPMLNFKDYNVTMSYNGSTVVTPLIYIPVSNLTSIYPDITQPIFNYNEIVDSLNNAFVTCRTDLLALQAGLPTATAPYVIYDPDSLSFDLYAEVAYESNLALPVEIFFDNALFDLFRGFSSFFESSDKVQILVQDRKVNSVVFDGTPSFKMESDHSPVSAWPDLQRVIIVSDSLPCRDELIGGQLNIQEKQITDFNYTFPVFDYSSLTYFPSGPLRMIDMISDTELRNVSIRFLWSDKEGVRRPFYVSEGNKTSCKIMFRRKLEDRINLYVNDDNDDM